MKARFVYAGLQRLKDEPPMVWGDYFQETEMSYTQYKDMNNFPEWRRIQRETVIPEFIIDDKWNNEWENIFSSNQPVQ